MSNLSFRSGIGEGNEQANGRKSPALLKRDALVELLVLT